jgi:flagellar export protein FliJ
MAEGDRAERFDGIVDVYKHREAERARRLSSAERQAATERARLEQLDGVRGEYRDGLADSQRQGIAATALKNWQRFMRGLDRAHVEQSGRVAKANEVRDARHGEWLAVYRRVKGFEKVADGLRAAARAAAARLERKEMDEIGSRRDASPSSSILKSRREGTP